VLNANGQPVTQLEGGPLYAYAETTSGPRRTWRGQQVVTFNGAQYGLNRFTLSVSPAGRFQFGTSCPGGTTQQGMMPSG
jgi:hypothetical protein